MFLPSFEFRLWNETNFDVNFCDFTKEAYRIEKYAFVSDVARVYALKKEGGIYLDTDMLLLKNFDDLLNFDFFLGEFKPNSLNAAIIGSSSDNGILKLILEYYENLKFNFEAPKTIPEVFDELIWGLPSSQVKIFSPEFFYPLPFSKRGEDFFPFITANTVAVHLWNHSWRNEFDYLKEHRFLKSLSLLAKHLFQYPTTYFNKVFLFRFAVQSKVMIKQFLHLKLKRNRV